MHTQKANEYTDKCTNTQTEYQTVRQCLGKDFFLNHQVPRVRAAHGMLYVKELNLEEFYMHSMELKKLTER